MSKLFAKISVFAAIIFAVCLIASPFKATGVVNGEGDMNYIIVVQDNQTAQFAAEELRDYTMKITGYNTPIYKLGEDYPKGKTVIWLGKTDVLNEQAGLGLSGEDIKWDGFKIQPVNSGVAVYGNEYRSIAYGVYEMLERQGCRFYGAYEYGEDIPEKKFVNYVPEKTILDNPDSYIRIYANEGWYSNGISQENDERLYAFGMKVRCNVLGRGYSQTIYAATEKYDYIATAGGHDANQLVTVADYNKNPNIWAEINGNRNFTYERNWCCNPSNGVFDIMAERLAATLRANRKIKLFQIYGVDTAATGGTRGGWCNCEWCRNYSSADLSLMSIIEVANRLKEEFPDVLFGNAYYHDTIDASAVTFTKDQIPDNCYAIWCPREMCPMHTIDDTTCEKNVMHKYYYDKIYELFGDKVYGFLYYGDGVLYNKGAYYNAEKAIKDVRYFVNHGMRSYLELSTNQVGAQMYDMTESVVFRIMWNNNFDAETFLNEFKCWKFGTDLATANRVTDLLRDVTCKVNRYCGYTLECDTRYVMVKNEHDSEFAKVHYNGIRESLPEYEELDKLLASLAAKSDDIGVKTRIGTLRCHLIMTKNVAETTAWSIEALDRKYMGDGSGCSDCMDEAIILLNAMKSIYDSFPREIRDGNDYWYKGALGDDLINLYNWLKY